METYEKIQILDEIMINYGTSILKLSYSYVKNYQIAEDITQEVFLTCFLKLDEFERRSSLKTWLYRITINKCKDYLKSWGYKFTILTEQLTGHSEYEKKNVPERLVMLNEEKKQLLNAIMNLPLKYREILFLYYYEELSLREVSVLIKTNENTVKSRMARAKELLKTKLSRGDEDVGITIARSER